ncbi:MAG: ATP-grasp domain-containing protein [Acidimicrobiales bacterium]
MTLALDPELYEPEAPAVNTVHESESVRLSHPGPATILFVDNRNWGCFFQLESGLRRAGFRTVRVTTGAVSRSASALCFDRTLRLRSADELERLPEILEGETIIDVQVTESLAVATFGALAAISDSPHRATWARRRAAVDKLYVSDVLHRRGVHTPETVPAYLTSAEYVADVLGLPVVHKPRRGSGGAEVSIVRTMKGLREILAGEGGTEDYFFERFIDGDPLQFSGVISKGRALLNVTYQTLDRRCDNGPASMIRCIEDMPLEHTGELVARTLGIDGMINVNVIRDAEGRDWVHDVNPRVWGSCLAFRSASLNFCEAYVGYLKGTAPLEPHHRAAAGSELMVFPAALESSKIGGANGYGVLPFAKGVWPYLRWLGPRYAAYESVRHLRRVAYGLLRPDAAESTAAEPAPIVPLSVPAAVSSVKEDLLAS